MNAKQDETSVEAASQRPEEREWGRSERESRRILRKRETKVVCIRRYARSITKISAESAFCFTPSLSVSFSP